MLDDDPTKRLLEQALALYRDGQLDAAERAFHDLHPDPHTRGSASYGLGLVELRRRNADSAYAWFSMVPASGPKGADARYYMAAIASERDGPAAAARLCDEALELAPRHFLALKLRGRLGRSRSPDPQGIQPGRSRLLARRCSEPNRPRPSRPCGCLVTRSR